MLICSSLSENIISSLNFGECPEKSFCRNDFYEERTTAAEQMESLLIAAHILFT
jgi:hypothetical protein